MSYDERMHMNMKGKKAVVTGGAGFIGSHIVDALIDGGYEVVVIDDLSAGKKENVNAKATLQVQDMCDQKAIEPLFNGADIVFHLAARPRVQYSIKHPDETNRINIGGTVSVLMSAQHAGVRRVVYSASSSAYGNQKELPLRETMTPDPLSPYGLQKYVGELYMKLFSDVYGIETVSLRYFNVYGPRLDPDGQYALVIGKFLKQKKEGTPLTIWGDGSNTRDYTHVSDIVRGNMLAATGAKVGKGEVINLGAGRQVTVNELAEIIGGEVVHEEPRTEPKHTLADTARANELLGWKPSVKIEDGIEELKEIFGIA